MGIGNPYKDEKGHWTTKENDGGPCKHEGGNSGGMSEHEKKLMANKGIRDAVVDDNVKGKNEGIKTLLDDDFDNDYESDFEDSDHMYDLYGMVDEWMSQQPGYDSLNDDEQSEFVTNVVDVLMQEENETGEKYQDVNEINLVELIDATDNDFLRETGNKLMRLKSEAMQNRKEKKLSSKMPFKKNDDEDEINSKDKELIKRKIKEQLSDGKKTIGELRQILRDTQINQLSNDEIAELIREMLK